MWVSFLRVVLRRFLAAAIDLNRQGGIADRRYQISVSEGFVRGVSFGLGFEVCSEDTYSEVRGYRSVHGQSQQLFLTFFRATYPVLRTEDTQGSFGSQLLRHKEENS